MKKISILFSLLLCFSFNVYAGTIYCFSANKGNELLKSTIPTNLIESDKLKYFKIDDKKKQFRQIKGYGEYKRKIKYGWQDNNDYDFYYQDSEKAKIFWKSRKFNRFNENEIELTIDSDTKSGKKGRYKIELDRIAGILLIANIELDENGKEIARDREDNDIIYKKGDDEFKNHLKKNKYFCEKHKNL
tara:strand:- start:51 stop:614 length:564 start_codon:yes stop_codon:yes gene_type:complete